MNRWLCQLPLQFLVPLAVLIHSICSAKTAKLFVIGTADTKGCSLGLVHGYIIHVTEFQFGDLSLTFWTKLFMSVQHMNPAATITVVHVHHEKFPFSHNLCKSVVCRLLLYCVSYHGQSQAYIDEKCLQKGVKYRAVIAQLSRKVQNLPNIDDLHKRITGVRRDGCILSGGKDINIAIALFICYNNTE